MDEYNKMRREGAEFRVQDSQNLLTVVFRDPVVRRRVRFERDSLMRNWFYMLILKRRGNGERREGVVERKMGHVWRCVQEGTGLKFEGWAG